MRPTPALKQKVDQKIDELMAAAKKEFGDKLADFRRPTIVYKVRGRTAGQANPRNHTIDLNAVLLNENGDAFIDRTPGHELSHLIQDKLYPWTLNPGRGRKRSIHGHEWKSIMIRLGLDPSTYHSYDTTNSRVKKRGQYKYRYTCSSCGKTMDLGSKRHAKMKSGVTRYWLRGCAHHNGFTLTHVVHPDGSLIKQNGAAPATQVAPRPVPAPKPARRPARRPRNSQGTGISKKAQALTIVQGLLAAGSTRKTIIRRLQDALGMTPAGAATYYQNSKKELGL